ncbi:hypothetical protein [Rhizobium sp. S163]|uniref:hypothetical protein n=1 Tax=Rhizobium sp. S163 TaxID=3055039 RepID=UPI0025AA2064|nr:hypothetical protein [Rhizobium sp. S163]MDM9643866.1 hypothetical protein [Rhizobium sp. S163]
MNVTAETFNVAAYLDHVKATHMRMISPANAVKDTAASRYVHRIKPVAEEPTPEKEVVAPEFKKSTVVLERIAAIQALYYPGITAKEIAQHLGVTKNSLVGFYRRNPYELGPYPLVARPGRKGKR